MLTYYLHVFNSNVNWQVFQRAYPIIHQDFERAKLEKQKKSRKKGKLKGKVFHHPNWLPLIATDKLPVSLDSCSNCDGKKVLSMNYTSTNSSKDSEPLSLVPPDHTPTYKAASCSSSKPLPSISVVTDHLLPSLPLSTTILLTDSDSDDEPSLLEILKTFKCKQPSLKASQFRETQQDTHTDIEDQLLYKPRSPVLLTSSDEDELSLFSRLSISEAVSTTVTTTSTITENSQTQKGSHFSIKHPTLFEEKPCSGSKEQPILID